MKRRNGKLALLVRYRELGEQQRRLEFGELVKREQEAEEAVRESRLKIDAVAARQAAARSTEQWLNLGEYENLLQVAEVLEAEHSKVTFAARNVELLKRKKSQALTQAIKENKAAVRREARQREEMAALDRTRTFQSGLDQWIAANKEKK